MPRNIIVEPNGAGIRIDKFLAERIDDASRSSIQKKIESGAVTLNGKTVTPHHLLRPGDVVIITDAALSEKPVVDPLSVPAPAILFENDSVLVINKPAGLTVHPGAGTHGATLIDWLVTHVPSIVTVGDDPTQRPGIVHRLDRDVSGAMVIAKTQASYENLKQQFKERTVNKQYVALVHGIPTSGGTIEGRITRSKRMHGKMRTTNDANEGRDAITHFEIIRKVKNNALLEITIETGRTHQIRVHCKSIGHPIVGDTVYTTKPYRHKTEPISRPFLHAAHIEFTDLDGSRRAFDAPLPEDLRRFLSS